MAKKQEKIRYKYRKAREGVILNNVKCPVCGSTHKNFKSVVEHVSWAGNVKLLVECWSGDIYEDKPRHVYLINLKELPVVEVEKVKIKHDVKRDK